MNNTLGQERRSSVTGKKVRDYVDNKKFTREVIAYNERHKIRMDEGKPQERMPDIIGLGIMKIADGLGSRHNFRGYTYVDEMVADAIVQAVYAVTRFKVDKLKLHYVEQKINFTFIDPKHYKKTKKTKEEEELFIKAKKANPATHIFYAGSKIKEPNAYGYLTLVMWRSMTARIKEEAEQQRLIESLMMDPSFVCYEADENDNDHGVDITKENAVDFYFDGK